MIANCALDERKSLAFSEKIISAVRRRIPLCLQEIDVSSNVDISPNAWRSISEMAFSIDGMEKFSAQRCCLNERKLGNIILGMKETLRRSNVKRSPILTLDLGENNSIPSK